jgi:hypothetical protein
MTPVPMDPLAGSLAPLGSVLVIGLVTLRILLPRGLPLALGGGLVAGLLAGLLLATLARLVTAGLAPAAAGGGSTRMLGPGPGLPGMGEWLSVGSILVYGLALGAALRRWHVPLFEPATLVLLLPGLLFQLLVVSGVAGPLPAAGVHLLPPAAFMLDLRSLDGATAAPGFGTGAAVWGIHVALLLAVAARGGGGRPRRYSDGSDPAAASGK